MRINAIVVGDEPEVSTELIAAQAVQPWMLLYSADTDEVDVVVGEPQPFQQESPSGRPERWVSIDVADDEPVTAPAAERLEVVFGTDAKDLQPMLDEDLYQPTEEALARAGMCHEQIPPDDDAEPDEDEDEDEEPVWCGRPSDPNSFHRLCTDHDTERRQQSERVTSYGFNPTYAAIVPLA
jgi:hypothetical protein